MIELNADGRDFIVEHKAGLQLDSRARCFRRAVERLFHAKDGAATEATYLAAQRRWKELRRALRRYERIGGQPPNRTFMVYHLAEAQEVWASITTRTARNMIDSTGTVADVKRKPSDPCSTFEE